ncbi:MAG: helix-turn-helix domain-containing protein [Treponema sp.]|nr:helix-turn-helix domain-containing protein [Treponema sp.]
MTLAEKCGTSTSYIGQIEIGNRFPSMEMIEKIAAALRIKPYVLFIDDPGEEITLKSEKQKPYIMSDTMKDELVKRLNNAIRKVVKRIN